MTTYSDAIDIITEETERWFNARAWFQLEKDEDAGNAINREMGTVVLGVSGTIRDHADCEVFYCGTCRSTYSPREFDDEELERQQCECGSYMTCYGHFEEHSEDFYRLTLGEIRQNVRDGLNTWCDGAMNEAIEAALECESDAAADWFRDGCTEGPKMYREEGGEMVQVVRRVLAAIETERAAKEYLDAEAERDRECELRKSTAVKRVARAEERR